LIGSRRREFLDDVLSWNTRELERKLAEFGRTTTYYNEARGHGSLAGQTPLTFASEYTTATADLKNVRWVAHCRGWTRRSESDPLAAQKVIHLEA
jgi:hypothetical protein